MKRTVTLALIAIAISGCGGGGGDAGFKGFPTQAAISGQYDTPNYIMLSLDSLKMHADGGDGVSGSMNLNGMGNSNAMTLDLKITPQSSAGFEGVAAKKTRLAMAIRSGGAYKEDVTVDVYYKPTPFTYLGAIASDGTYETVVGKTNAIPDVVNIGETGILYKTVVWENSDQRRKVDRTTVSWLVKEATADTAWICQDVKSNRKEGDGSTCVEVDKKGRVLRYELTLNTIEDDVGVEMLFKSKRAVLPQSAS